MYSSDRHGSLFSVRDARTRCNHFGREIGRFRSACNHTRYLLHASNSEVSGGETGDKKRIEIANE
jgi:hypothetical protein